MHKFLHFYWLDEVNRSIGLDLHMDASHVKSFKCYCLRKPGDMAKSRNMKVVQIYSFLVW